MGLNSMTGFARADAEHGGTRWHWEVKSVNGRSLDVRCRLPERFERLEQELRATVGARITRGNCQIALQISRIDSSGSISVNEDALERILATVEEVRDRLGSPPPSAEGVLALRGVLEPGDAKQEDDGGELVSEILKSFPSVIEQLVSARSAEGAKLKAVVEGQLSRIESLAGDARNAPALQPESIRARLSERVSRILDVEPSFDPDRLHQEAVLIAAKVDVQEELDRLEAHLAAARDLLESGEPVGRKLDFLTQEFNREANTLCSKANDPALTGIGLQLKVVIDQMREQVQNIE